MKARISPQNKLSKKQVQAVRELVKSEVDTIQESKKDDYERRFSKIAAIALAKEFGFGKQRIEKFIAEFNKISNTTDKTDDAWYFIDRDLDRLGINLGKEDYAQMEKELHKYEKMQNRTVSRQFSKL